MFLGRVRLLKKTTRPSLFARRPVSLSSHTPPMLGMSCAMCDQLSTELLEESVFVQLCASWRVRAVDLGGGGAGSPPPWSKLTDPLFRAERGHKHPLPDIEKPICLSIFPVFVSAARGEGRPPQRALPLLGFFFFARAGRDGEPLLHRPCIAGALPDLQQPRSRRRAARLRAQPPGASCARSRRRRRRPTLLPSPLLSHAHTHNHTRSS